MSKFTQGEWSYSELCQGSNKRYLVQSSDYVDIGIIQREANARLIAAAPELYKMLKEELIATSDYGGILSFAREAKVHKLLTYIDGEEAEHE